MGRPREGRSVQIVRLLKQTGLGVVHIQDLRARAALAFYASSTEFVGEVWFGKIAKCVI